MTIMTDKQVFLINTYRQTSTKYQRVTACHLPQALTACDKPQIVPIFASRKEATRKLGNLYFRWFQNRICEKQISEMYIKSINESNSWHKRDHRLTERVWRRGYQVPDGFVQSTTKPTQSS